METQEKLKRWRLILGKEAEQTLEQMASGEMLSQEDLLMDRALGAIYGGADGFGGGAGSGPPSPQLSRWLGDLRALFSPMEVQVIQNDAIQRKGLNQLLFEPEVLDQLEPSIGTAALLLTLKDQIPSCARENARAYIAKIVEDINRRLADDLKRSVTAALNRREHSPIPSASALDYRMTIRRNLKHYDTQRQVLLPEKFYFFEHAARSASRTIILDIDQSGSMGESIIYASVLSCILASMRSLKTHIVAFDTQVTDLTELCADPVEVLYGIQMGGGTDIEKSIAYCAELVQEPAKTTLFLITDLEENGNRAGLLLRLEELKVSGVNVIVLLAISDSGKPCYDSMMAEKVSALEIPCFACPPERLPELLEAAMKHQSLQNFSR